MSSTAPDLRKRGWSMASEEGDITNRSSKRAKATEDGELSEKQKLLLMETYPAEEELLGLETGKQRSSQKEKKQQLPRRTLSKWTARLFDPNRIRGLVESPQTIPLNDEFLQAFGKREKSLDQKLGRENPTIEQEITLDDEDDDDDTKNQEQNNAMGNKKGTTRRKLKIANIGYRTTESALNKACSAYGPIDFCKLIMSKLDESKNAGRAYVTFENSEDAQQCLDRMTKLEGRPLRVQWAEDLNNSTSSKGKRTASSMARYWVKDVSTKCFRCGKVGHIQDKCPNPPKSRPCMLCGLDGHEMRECKFGRSCFQCGMPGHINRDCPNPQARISATRLFCSACFRSGHNRERCRHGAASAHSAICMVCNKEGHFLCKDMKWFFGLDGISCYNCGRNGHHGMECDRAPLDVCARDPEISIQEWSRAEAMQLQDEMSAQQQARGRNRNVNHSDRGNHQRGRPQSQPPAQHRSLNRGYQQPDPRNNNRGYQNNNNNRGRY